MQKHKSWKLTIRFLGLLVKNQDMLKIGRGINLGLYYTNLDAKTREFMLKEIELDCQSGKLYFSPRLNTIGQSSWESLLKEAAQLHDDDWLANELRNRHCMNSHEARSTRSGGITSCQVPVNAPDTLSEGEFNRFYCRGLCARGISEEVKEVEVYRGKQVQTPRPESQAKIGNRLDPAALLNDLRTCQGVDTALGIPKGPNSGLTIKLPAK
jgi:hypothetical protein